MFPAGSMVLKSRGARMQDSHKKAPLSRNGNYGAGRGWRIFYGALARGL